MSTFALVDFHCHLDLYPDFKAAVQRCEDDRVFTLTVTTTPKAWPKNQEITATTRYVRAALGLHPQLVAERAQEIALWEDLLPKTRYIGEVGLDAGPRYYKSLEKQKEVFARVLDLCAVAGNKVLSVHSIRATKAVLDMIEKRMPPERGQIVLHWFTGTAAEARRAVDLGCYFSINNAMIHNERHAAFVKALPPGRILTETDGPFTHVGNRPAEPKDVADAVRGLAALLNKSAIDIQAQVIGNLKVLLGDSQ